MPVLFDDTFCCNEPLFPPDTLVTETTLANNDVFEKENRLLTKLNKPYSKWGDKSAVGLSI